MKKRLLSVAVACMAFASISQTSLYTENFESGNSFTLNSPDLGGASTYNTWLMNNVFSGGSGTFVCFGFPFSFTVPNTPAQPVGITNAPSSNYMHIAAQAAVSNGINCASYIPADGTCVTNESNFTKMTNPVSTNGYTNVTFDFWWLCAGSVDAYGQVYYSLDGGTTWVLKQSNLNNVSTWTQLSLTDAAWDNQPSIKFAFRFVNNTAGTAADPAFSVDEIEISGTPGVVNSIATSGGIVTNQWCEGTAQSLTVDFVASGTYTAGNVYTAEISDASGSFAAPQQIGTLASTANGALSINATTPVGLAVGSGYRVRVTASSPSTIGTDNGADLTVNALPTVSQAPFTDACVNAGSIALVGGSPAGGSYTGTGVSGGSFSTTTAGVGTHTITYSYTDANGCSNTASAPITVNDLPAVTLGSFANICDNAGALTLTGGSPAGGVYSGTGVTAGVFDPAAVGAGVYTIAYAYTDANNCQAQATQTITVDGCSGLNELMAINVAVFPNPAKSSFSISGNIPFDVIRLVDLNGKEIKSYTMSESYALDGVPAGMYMIVLKNATGTYQGKLLVE